MNVKENNKPWTWLRGIFYRLYPKKMFAYENNCGDKGVIVAPSYEVAEQIFHATYPERKIVNNLDDYDMGGAYLMEAGAVKGKKLYNVFPW